MDALQFSCSLYRSFSKHFLSVILPHLRRDDFRYTTLLANNVLIIPFFEFSAGDFRYTAILAKHVLLLLFSHLQRCLKEAVQLAF